MTQDTSNEDFRKDLLDSPLCKNNTSTYLDPVTDLYNSILISILDLKKCPNSVETPQNHHGS